ncbi:MAG: HlyC/CorC family transporter [Armatimonadetes bacterium]|nr:HlyC/CorC family transporter [Armatimonadota bacterium]
MLVVLAVIALLIGVNALYVAAEFASVAARRTRIEALARQGDRAARMLLPHLRDATALDRYVAACQIGITISSLVLGAYGQRHLADWLREPLVHLGGLQHAVAESLAAVIVLVLLTALQVVLGELVPKSIAIRFPEPVALSLTWPMVISLRVMRWFIAILNGTGTAVLRALRIPIHAHRHVHSPEELEHLLAHGAHAGNLHAQARRSLRRARRALRFAERRLRDVVVPRTAVVAVDRATTVAEVRAVARRTPFTRFPVYEGGVDNVVGMVHVKAILLAPADDSTRVDEAAPLHAMPAFPVALPADEALEAMRRARAQMAIVLDEYGGTAGVVTLEDLLEEVLGDLHDEFDRTPPSLVRLPDGSLQVRGDLSLEALADEIGERPTVEGVHTVGGLLLHLMGPGMSVGATVRLGRLELTVLQARGPRVISVRARRLPATEA